MTLFQGVKLGRNYLNNRIVMAPMTRFRADEKGVPFEYVAEYYTQRATAGLIISEGIAPSINGSGYAQMPGLYSNQQIKEWSKVTKAVHEAGGKIFAQLMHTGRCASLQNMERGAKILSASAVKMEGEVRVKGGQKVMFDQPYSMSFIDIENTIKEYVIAAKNAIKAGFDGVEIHGANGYLIEQFLNPTTNQREDKYGGSNENRNRFGLELISAVSRAIGGDRTAIRLSPCGTMGEMKVYEEIDQQYYHLINRLNSLDLAYLHLLDHATFGNEEVPQNLKDMIRVTFKGALIMGGGFTKKNAEKVLKQNKTDLIAFGRAFIANPDLVDRMRYDMPLNEPKSNFSYIGGEEGYIDYPTEIFELMSV